jgi:hypothetical protein
VTKAGQRPFPAQYTRSLGAAESPEGLRAFVIDLTPRKLAAVAGPLPPLAEIGAIQGALGADGACAFPMSRCSLWFMGFDQGVPPDAAAADTPTLLFELRCAVNGVDTLAAGGVITPTPTNATGLVVQSAGILCQEWRLFAQLGNTPAGAPPPAVVVEFWMCADRLGTGPFANSWGAIVPAGTRTTAIT